MFVPNISSYRRRESTVPWTIKLCSLNKIMPILLYLYCPKKLRREWQAEKLYLLPVTTYFIKDLASLTTWTDNNIPQTFIETNTSYKWSSLLVLTTHILPLPLNIFSFLSVNCYYKPWKNTKIPLCKQIFFIKLNSALFYFHKVNGCLQSKQSRDWVQEIQVGATESYS